MALLGTDDRRSLDSTAVELGLRYLQDTPRHLRGSLVPALKALGLTAMEACLAARLPHLRPAEAPMGPPSPERKRPAGYEPAGLIESHYQPKNASTSPSRRKGGSDG